MDTNRPKTTEYQPTPIKRPRKTSKVCGKSSARKKSYRAAWQVPNGQAVPERLRPPAVRTLSMAPDMLQARALEKYAWIQKSAWHWYATASAHVTWRPREAVRSLNGWPPATGSGNGVVSLSRTEGLQRGPQCARNAYNAYSSLPMT